MICCGSNLIEPAAHVVDALIGFASVFASDCDDATYALRDASLLCDDEVLNIAGLCNMSK